MSLQTKVSLRGSAFGLLISALVISGAGPIAGQSSAQDDAAERSVPGYARWAAQVLASPPAAVQFLPALEDRLAERAGRARGEHALGTLSREPGLQRAARAHAVDMLQRDYTSHIDPAGRSAAERVGILDRRFIGVTGENLAEQVGIPADAVAEQVGPTASKLVSGFLDSPEHRRNLLDPDYTDQGIGAAAAGDRLIVVHVFGARRAALRQDLPLQVPHGAELPLAFAQGEGLSTPAKYAFAKMGQRPGDVVPLDLSLTEVAVEPGTYQLQFLFSTGQSNRFAVVPGPILVVE